MNTYARTCAQQVDRERGGVTFLRAWPHFHLVCLTFFALLNFGKRAAASPFNFIATIAGSKMLLTYLGATPTSYPLPPLFFFGIEKTKCARPSLCLGVLSVQEWQNMSETSKKLPRERSTEFTHPKKNDTESRGGEYLGPNVPTMVKKP